VKQGDCMVWGHARTFLTRFDIDVATVQCGFVRFFHCLSCLF
jgi:hypothetical protein